MSQSENDNSSETQGPTREETGIDAGQSPVDDTAAQPHEFKEGVLRKPTGWDRHLIAVIAVAWSLFQLSIASWLTLDSTAKRCIHLAFAILIAFLSYPCLRKPRFGLKFLAVSGRIPVIDYLLGIVAAGAALYLWLDYAGVSTRSGDPIVRDLVIGIVLIVLLLEASRRVIGLALSVVAIAFTAYAFLGPHLPLLIAFKGASLGRFVNQMTLTTEGVYGIPLDVSVRTIFLFVLFGSMLERGGGGKYFIDMALSLLGPFRGGPAKAAVMGSGLTGMISGSSIANIVTTGTFTIPLMKKVGYPAEKAAAIEVAASTDGQIAPPIMGAAAFIIAEYVNVPYVDVVKAAAIPAFASYATLFYITHLEACKLGLLGIPRADLTPFFKVFVSGLHFLIPLAFLLYQLVIARVSPQLAAFHAVWVLGVIMLLQHAWRSLRRHEPVWPAFKRGLMELLEGLAAGGRNMVTVALATATAGIIVGVVSLGLGGLITQIIERISMGNIFLLLAITAFASLIIGMGLPTTATYIVMATLIAPVIVVVGNAYGLVVPLMAAHLFCFYFGILADDTPPVGLAAYAASAIAKSPPIPTGIQAFIYDIRTAILPFMFIFNTDLILHGIHRWDQGILIFVMACVGTFAFAAATQGWFVTRNRLWEIPFFLGVTLIMLQPRLIAQWCGMAPENRYWAYLIGIAVLVLLYLLQKRRVAR